MDPVPKKIVFNVYRGLTGILPLRRMTSLEEEGVAIRKAGKLCGGYYFLNRYRKTWDVKEGGDTGHIRAQTVKVIICLNKQLCLSEL